MKISNFILDLQNKKTFLLKKTFENLSNTNFIEYSDFNNKKGAINILVIICK